MDHAIANANSRVWLLAVAFSEKVNLERFADSLKDKLESSTKEKRKFDLKILVADPLRSPAVFRSFLESTAKQNEMVYKHPRPSDENSQSNLTAFRESVALDAVTSAGAGFQ